MKPLTAQEVEAYLRRYGFRLVRIHGSHHQWGKAGHPAIVSVPHHGNVKLKQGLLNGIFNDAGIPKPVR